MASCTFTSTSVSPTNTECANGRNVSVAFTKTGGTLPPTGSVLKSIKCTFTHLNVYTSQSPRFVTSYGTFYLSEGTQSTQTVSATGASSSILSFTGGTITFEVQSNREAGKNVLNPKAGIGVTMVVEYDVRTASTGKLSSATGTQGKALTLAITAVDSSFTHTVVWQRDSSHSTTQNINAGVTSTSFTVPTSWPVGAATCKLTTYYNGSQVGSTQTYNFTVAVDPNQTYPTGGTIGIALQQGAYVPSSWRVYVQGHSRAKLTLSGHSAGTSATIKEILLKIGSQQQQGTSATFTSGVITDSGTIAYSGKVTNSFGNSSDSSGGQITVYPYESPKISSIVAFRCLQDGTPNDYGTYMSITAYASFSSVNGKNSKAAFQCQFALNDGSEVWSSATNLESGVTQIVSGLNDTSGQYKVRVTFIDQIQNLAGTSTTLTTVVLTSECILFFMDGGLNVSIGTQGTHQNAIDINSNWDVWWGDEKLTGTVPISRGGTGATTVAGARNALGLGNTSGALPIANGGTGQTTVAAARNALGLGNTSGALPVANGGTGAADAATARSNLGITPANIGAAASSHNHAGSAITSGTINAARLPFKVKYGTVTLSGASWQTVGLSGFSNTPIILVSYTDDAASSGLNPLKTRNRSASSFDVCMAGSGSGSRTICYLAIGT